MKFPKKKLQGTPNKISLSIQREIPEKKTEGIQEEILREIPKIVPG